MNEKKPRVETEFGTDLYWAQLDKVEDLSATSESEMDEAGVERKEVKVEKKEIGDKRKKYVKEGESYECPYGCGQKYENIKKLYQHVRLHKEKSIYECRMCDRKYTRKKSLDYHLKTFHDEPWFVGNAAVSQ